MSTTRTARMLAYYEQEAASPLMFLSGFFQSPAGNFHTTEEVELDIVRGDEEIAVVIQDLTVGSRMNSTDLYTNKSFVPPIFDEAFALNSHDLLKRVAGEDPFQNPEYRANLTKQMVSGMGKVERKIRRSNELQASQVLQTGKLSLKDSGGVALYELDYKPKATHFPTAAVSWATATGAQMLAHLESLGEVIRNDGLDDPDQLLMGIDAFEKFISNDAVRARFDTRRIDLGSLGMGAPAGNGSTFQGLFQLGNYQYAIYTYGGRYKDPQTGAKVQYLDEGKIVMRASGGRLDATYGAIPNIGSMIGGSNRILPELPGRMSSTGGGMDLFTNVWVSPNGKQLFGGVAARPLFIPTAIDTFGCLDTQL
jgi:hypothetical protein